MSTTRLIWIIAVVPISAATFALASGNLLALGTLEALEATSTLRIRVALSPTCFQVFGSAAVRAAQRLISGVVRSAVVRAACSLVAESSAEPRLTVLDVGHDACHNVYYS